MSKNASSSTGEVIADYWALGYPKDMWVLCDWVEAFASGKRKRRAH